MHTKAYSHAQIFSLFLVEYRCDKLQQQLERRPGVLCSVAHLSAGTHPVPGTYQPRQGTHAHILCLDGGYSSD